MGSEKLITVCEGDYIFCKKDSDPDWKGNNRYHEVEDEKTFQQLMDFVLEKNEELVVEHNKSIKRGNANDDDPVEIMHPSFRSKQKVFVLQAGSYVGSIITKTGAI